MRIAVSTLAEKFYVTHPNSRTAKRIFVFLSKLLSYINEESRQITKFMAVMYVD
jgi:hypothetical protein